MKPESHLARVAREIREAKAAGKKWKHPMEYSRERKAAAAAASNPIGPIGPISPISPILPAPRPPRTKLKRRPVKTVTVEVEKKPLLVLADNLFPHPLLGRIGMLPDMIKADAAAALKSGSKRADRAERAGENATEFAGLVDSILEEGLRDPLKVVRDPAGYAIADGRHRWEACREIIRNVYANPANEAFARRLQSEGIPCVEIPAAEAPAVILAGITRRHLSKQARSLLAISVYPKIAEDAHSVSRKGNDYPFKTQEDLASRIGVGLETMKDACEFWREIALRKKPDRAAAMNSVFAGISFSNVREGMLGAAASKGVKPPAANHGKLLFIAATSMIRQFGYYDSVPREDQLRYLETMVTAMKKAPAEVRTAILTALNP